MPEKLPSGCLTLACVREKALFVSLQFISSHKKTRQKNSHWIKFWFDSDTSEIIKKWLINRVLPTKCVQLRCQLPSVCQPSFWYMMNLNMSPSSQL